MSIKLLIKNFLINNIINNQKNLVEIIKDGKYNRFKFIVDYLKSITPQIDDTHKFTQRIEWFIHDRHEFQRCQSCGREMKNPRRFISVNQGYRPTCGEKDCVKNAISLKAKNFWDTLSKNDKKVFIERRSEKFRDYLKEHQSEWLNKIHNTYFEKTGYKNPSQNPYVKQKKEETTFKNYGVRYYKQTSEYKKWFQQNENIKGYNKILNNKYVIPLFSLNDYVAGDREKIYKWKCNECGKEFEDHINYSWFSHGQVRSYAKCPNCYPNIAQTSNEERDVVKFLRESVSEYEIIYDEKINHEIIKNGWLDILLKDVKTNEIKFAIEYDGLYWHCIEKKSEDYKFIKTIKCEDQGINLIHIFEDEWIYDKENTKNMILNILKGNIEFKDEITLDRSKITKVMIPDTYEIVEEIPHKIIERYDLYSKYLVGNCGYLKCQRRKF